MTSRSKFGKSRKKNAENTAHLLKKKLDSAEDETQGLVQQLATLGFAPEKLKAPSVAKKKHPGSGVVSPVEPFLPAAVETETLYKSYEQLVSRACRTESQIQTLKLNLCSLQAEKELNTNEVENLKEKLQSECENHHAEIQRLEGQIEGLKKKLSESENGRKEAEKEKKRLEAALKAVDSSKSDMESVWDIQKIENVKQMKTINQLKQELLEESSRRIGLEDSHRVLLQRIQEMEQVVERERKDMQTLVTACTKMKSDYELMKEKRNQDSQEKTALEDALKRLKVELNKSDVHLGEILQENQALVVAAESMKKQTASLKEDVENLRKMEKDKLEYTELKKHKGIADDQIGELRQKNEELHIKCEDLQREIGSLKEDLHTARQVPHEATEMVAVAVQELTEEKSKILEEVQALQIELKQMADENFQLQNDKQQLEERITTVELQDIANKKVESTIAELVEGKNRLAYEKGQLHQQLDHLQKELEKATSTQTENNHLKRSKVSLETKVKKVNDELSANQLTIHKLQAQLRQEKNSSDMKERDFELAIQARDAALQEVEQMRKKMEGLENQQQLKIFGLHKSLSDAQSDHSKMSSMLDSVMASHQQIQMSAEGLQTELGRKDREINSLKQERQNNLRTLQHLQGEIKSLQHQISAMEDEGLGKTDQLHRQLMESKNENNQLAVALEELSQTNKQLQSALDGIQNEADRKSYEIKLLQEARGNDQRESEQQIQSYQDRLESVQSQLANQKSLVQKRTQKEVSDLRSSNMDMAARISELSKDNSDLHQRVSGLEGTMARQKDRIKSQKMQLESLLELKKENKDLVLKREKCEAQLEMLEKAKKDYLHKNKEQAKTIAEFIGQVNDLQGELKEVTEQQSRNRHSRQRSKASDSSKGDSLRRENEKLKQRLGETEKEKQTLEKRLMDASLESSLVSDHLQNAHDWFQQKYSGLQRELVQSKRRNERLEGTTEEQNRQLEEERVRSEEQMQKAYQIIKSSREALKKVANQVEREHIESKFQMNYLAKRVQAERDHANYTDQKMNRFLNSSAQYIEDLSVELDLTRSKLEQSPT